MYVMKWSVQLVNDWGGGGKVNLIHFSDSCRTMISSYTYFMTEISLDIYLYLTLNKSVTCQVVVNNSSNSRNTTKTQKFIKTL